MTTTAAPAQRTMAAVNQECQEAVLQLGQKAYHAHLLDREIQDLKARVYNLNVEAFNMNQAMAAAQAELAAQAAPAAEAQADKPAKAPRGPRAVKAVPAADATDAEAVAHVEK